MTDFVIEVELPDGYHWFSGFGNHPEATKKNIDMPMNCWSPYKQDAFKIDNEDIANKTNELLAGVGAKVVPYYKAKFHRAYIKMENGLFRGCKRAGNLQMGDRFMFTTSGNYFVVVDLLGKTEKRPEGTTVVYKNEATNKTATLGRHDKRFIYFLLQPVKL